MYSSANLTFIPSILPPTLVRAVPYHFNFIKPCSLSELVPGIHLSKPPVTHPVLTQMIRSSPAVCPHKTMDLISLSQHLDKGRIYDLVHQELGFQVRKQKQEEYSAIIWPLRFKPTLLNHRGKYA